MKLQIIFCLASLIVAAPSIVLADNQSKPTETSEKSSPMPIAGASSLIVSNPNDDFAAVGGGAYFIRRPGITCTLPPAAGCPGKFVLLIPCYKSFKSYSLQTSSGEHVYSRGYEYEYVRRARYNLSLISDGQNWNLFHYNAAYGL
jgi:hypothetical protein